jgi:transcriptional regulator with XRE-family HTH domain
MATLEELEARLLKKPKYREALMKVDMKFLMSVAITDLRVRKGLTQAKLASMIGTKQPSIARWEAGQELPSVRSLNKIAKACKMKLDIKFVPLTGSKPYKE